MSKIEVNAIEPQCGTTLTIGASGDTVSLPSGVTLSGVGTVSWDTTAKTSAFTAVSGNGYFVNTTSAAITVTLPASPSAGDIVAVSDYAQTASTNSITVARNSSNIEGDASDLVIQRNGVAMTFVYVDGTRGWKVVDSGAESDKEPTAEYIVASGGTETTCGNYKIHTFTGPGTFTVTCVGNAIGSNTVSYLVVAGGGGGGTVSGAGGGAGGYREGKASSDCYTASPLVAPAGLPVTAQGYPITVGGGGNGGAGRPANDCGGASGSNSVFSTITSTGGGGGGTGNASGPTARSTGSPGGSGGGGTYYSIVTPGMYGPGGTGNTPPVSPSQGNNGSTGQDASPFNELGAGGGGGATAAGGPVCASLLNGGAGGAGATTSISGSSTAYAGGGGGGTGAGTACTPATSGGAGGTGGGGAGTNSNTPAPVTGNAGTVNTGGGGGGLGWSSGSPEGNGGAGGSGIVIIRYKYQ
jgi:hypothetical protein